MKHRCSHSSLALKPLVSPIGEAAYAALAKIHGADLLQQYFVRAHSLYPSLRSV